MKLQRLHKRNQANTQALPQFNPIRCLVATSSRSCFYS